MKPPYIGVTGLATLNDVEYMRELASTLKPGVRHNIMAGVLISHKTWSGLETTNRRYPNFSLAKVILSHLQASHTWPVIHYNTSGCKDPLSEQLLRVAKSTKCWHFQLNVVNPEVEEIRKFKEMNEHSLIILQVNKKSVEEPTPKNVISYVKKYSGVIDHALIDMSGGRGVPFDPKVVAPILRSWDMDITPGVAGGISDTSYDILWDLKNLAPLVDFRNVSLDAESGLRDLVPDPIEGADYQDQLNYKKVGAYLRRFAGQMGQ